MENTNIFTGGVSKLKASAWQRGGGAAHLTPSRRDAAIVAAFVAIIYLCGYFCWFAAMIQFWSHSIYHEFWTLLGSKIRSQYNAVAAGSFIAFFSAALLCPVIVLQEGAHAKLTQTVLRRGAAVLCSLHIVGAVVFMGGMGAFIHNDNRGTLMYQGPSTGTEMLGMTTRQLLIPVFSSVCLVYLCVVLVAGLEVPALPATVALANMTWWLYLCGFFFEFATKDDGRAAAAGIATGAFIAAKAAVVGVCIDAGAAFMPSVRADPRRGKLVLVLAVLHGAGWFIFFCSACSWLHRSFDKDKEKGFDQFSYMSSQHLKDVTLFIFMPLFFTVYLISRSVRQARALLGGYDSIEGAAVADPDETTL